jgi:hypothetical protein
VCEVECACDSVCVRKVEGRNKQGEGYKEEGCV